MAINSVLSAGLQGVQKGMQGMQRHAQNIASAPVTQEEAVKENRQASDLAEDIVGLKQNELQVKASTKVIESAKETIGTLLDIRA